MKKALAFVAIVFLTLLLALPTLATEESPSLDGIIEYKGLCARSVQDYAGLRSLYTVNEDAVAALEKQGYKVLYGALMGVGCQAKEDGTTVTGVSSVDQMTAGIENKKIVAFGNGKKGFATAAVLVYATDASYEPTKTYVERTTNEAGERTATFAYTTTYTYTQRTPQYFKNTELVFRAFIMLLDADGKLIETHYEDATSAIFGQNTATYGSTTSLYEVCKYLTAEAADQTILDQWKNNFALLSVIEDCQNKGFEKIYAADPDTDQTGIVELTEGVTLELPDMQAGLYKLTLTGKTHVSTDALVTVEAEVGTGHFKMRTQTAYPTYTDIDTVYLMLPSGTSTLTLSGYGTADTNKLNIAKIKLTQVEKFAASESILYTMYDEMKEAAKDIAYQDSYPGIADDYNGFAKNISFLKIRDETDGYRYYKTSTGNINKHDNDLIGVTWQEFPEAFRYNCFINVGTDTAGFGYFCDNEGLFLGENDEIRFTVTAPKTGVYAVYLPYATNKTPTVTLSNITPGLSAPAEASLTLTPSLVKSPTGNSFGSKGTASTAASCASLGEVYLQAGENNLSVVSDATLVFTQIAFSPKPDYDTVTFLNANGDTVSVQKARTVEDLMAPVKYGGCKGKEVVEFDLTQYVPGEDITITAEEYDLHTVTFYSDDRTTVLATVKVKDYDGGATVPADNIPYMPPRENSLFTGWEGGDINCITGDSKLYAVYTEIEKSPIPYDYTVNGGTVLEATEGYHKSYTIHANGSKDADYLEFKVNASVAGFYKFSLQLDKSKYKVRDVKIYNTQLAYYGASQLDTSDSANPNSTANFAVPTSTTKYTYIGSQHLLSGENTIRIFVKGSPIAVSDVKVELGATVTDSDLLLYANDAVSVTNIVDDTNTGGKKVATKENTAQLRYNDVSLASAYYSFAGLMAYNSASAEMTVTFTHKTDPSLSKTWTFYPGKGRINGYGSSTELLQYTEEPVMLIGGKYDIVIDLPANTEMRYTMLALRLEEPIAGVLESVPAGNGTPTNASLNDEGAVLLTGGADSKVSFTLDREKAGFLSLSVVGTAAAGTTLYCEANGRLYTLPISSAAENAALAAKPTVYLKQGKNTVTFYCDTGDSFALRAFSGIPADGGLESGTDATVIGSLTSGKASLASSSNKTYDEAVYSFSVSESGHYALRLRGEVTHGAVLFYQLRDSEKNVIDPITGELLAADDARFYDTSYGEEITIDEYFIAYTAHYATKETVMDILPFPKTGDYTLTLRLYRSPDYEKQEGVPATVTADVNEIALVGMGAALEAGDAVITAGTPNKDTITGSYTLSAGDSMTFQKAAIAENAVYLARLFGRAEAGTVFTVTAKGLNTELLSAGDYYNRMLYKAVETGTVTTDNVTQYYIYNVITGVYDKAEVYNEETVYYEKTGAYSNPGDSFSFTVEGGSLADGFMTLDRFNLLSDMYDITVSVTAGSLSITELTLIREADYIRVIEIPVVENEKVVIASDNHYVRKNDAENQTILANSIVSEQAGAAFFDGDFTTTRLDARDTIVNGQAYYYAMSYEVNTLFAPLRENNIPMFVLHADHDHKSSEEWYGLFGYEKNYMVQMGATLYICLDYNYLQSDYFAYGVAGTVADISDAFCEAVLEKLDSDSVKQAVIVSHYYGIQSQPNIGKLWKHDKIMVNYGGHTHYNITTSNAAAGSLNTANKVNFAQTGHFAHVGNNKGLGQTQNPFVPLMHVSGDGAYYMTFNSVETETTACGVFSALGGEYKNANYGDSANTSGIWYTYAYLSNGQKIIAFRAEATNLMGETADEINLYLVDEGNDAYYPITSFGALSETPYAGSKVANWESSGNPHGYRILQTNTDGSTTYFETYMTYAYQEYVGFVQAHIHVRPEEMYGFVDRTYMRLWDVTD